MLANFTTLTSAQLTTTELHCSELYPGITDEEFTTAYADSFGLATLMLDQFHAFLCMPTAL